jgi:uncharacterized membrane protein
LDLILRTTGGLNCFPTDEVCVGLARRVRFVSTTYVATATLAGLVIGDRSWLIPAVLIAVAGVALAAWLNRQRLRSAPIGPICRVAGWMLLAACVANPLWSSSRPRSGANVVAVVTDISRSHLVSADGTERSRADAFSEALKRGERSEPVGWLKKLEQDFELRRYSLSDRLQQVDRFDPIEFNGTASSLRTALAQLKRRYEGQPLAGVILLSDGIATDDNVAVDDLKGLAPVYPVLPPGDAAQSDASIGTWAVTQTAFDDAPVTIQVQPTVVNATSGKIEVTLLDQAGVPVETQSRAVSDPSPLKFRHRPTEPGTVFYTLKTVLRNDSGEAVTEATEVNNQQLLAVERSTMPRRVLYVTGRPNWEFKFLKRAVQTDPQIQMVALVRIAKQEAKFDFRGREGERTNSLFRGFENGDKEVAEEYDEPVLVRINTKEDELVGGFPESPEELFRYDAIIIDDLEADFFLADQMKLIYDFVSRRGGGLLMMGGQESMRQGSYDRTPIGEVLPIDLSREMKNPTGGVSMSLTRDGWLQPWIRLRSDEASENERIAAMPTFKTINATSFVKPGALIMAEVQDDQETRWPALVVQRFGKGRSAALCVGDLWRWRLNEGLRKLHGPDSSSPLLSDDGEGGKTSDVISEDLGDHARACRQMIRWLVADVPKRLDLKVTEEPASGVGSVRITAFVRGVDFEARENADVKFKVTGPDGQVFELTGEPSDSTSGMFETTVAAAQPGRWMVTATATGTEDNEVEPNVAETGWASQPDQKEMKSVEVDRTFLQELATTTSGRLVELDELDSFVDELPASSAPLVEFWSWPIWHSWWIFGIAIACLCVDWTTRRRAGLP